MYDGDSFFTLDLAGMAGLLAFSATLALGMLLLARRIYRRWGLVQRLLAAAGLFWLFLWLSPQFYYAFYQLILDGLPVQLVVDAPPGPQVVFRRLIFAGPATLAAHGQAVLGWLLVVLAVRPQWFAWRI